MPEYDHLDWPFFERPHRELAHALDVWAEAHLREIDDSDAYEAARTLVRRLADGGWLQYCVRSEHGGIHERLDVRSLCLVRETLARFSSLADFAFAMQGIGSAPITRFGTDAMRERYLPAVASGEKIAAFALTERGSGSDAAAIQTTARQDGDAWVLSGDKTWISNTGIADFYVVFARTEEGSGARGLAAFVVDAETPGLEVSERIPMASPHPLGSLALNDCRVPAHAMLGEAGEGFKIAMTTLDTFRSTVGAAAVGFARRALAEALDHVRTRHVFGRQLSEFQMTQDKLATMATDLDAAALLVYRAAWCRDTSDRRVTREASMAKMFATESAQRVIDHAVQLLGGHGVASGSVVERLYRDIRPLRIYEGTTEIQKIIIASQLLRRS